MISSISSFLSSPLAKTESASTAATKALEDATKARRAFEVTEREKEKTIPANSAGSTGSGKLSGDTLLQAQTMGQKFLEFMDKTPEEMMREAILKELGYTEEDVANLDTEDRLKLEEQIRQMIQQKIEEAMREKGVDVDLSSAPLAAPTLIE
jgi:hypothetical protein